MDSEGWYLTHRFRPKVLVVNHEDEGSNVVTKAVVDSYWDFHECVAAITVGPSSATHAGLTR